MQRFEHGHFGLEEEFRKLSFGLELSLRSSGKIGFHLSKKFFRKVSGLFWFLLESPQLLEKIGPDKKRDISRIQRLDEVRLFIHPPSIDF